MARPDPLLRPTSQQLTVAPELGVLAALDAILATAAHQLAAQNPDLGPDVLARGYIPDPCARVAALVLHRIHDFRILLQQYSDTAAGPPPADDQPDF